MNIAIYIIVAFLFVIPIKIYAGFTTITNSDNDDSFLSAYYDLRDRSSFLQITNTSPSTLSIHVQIFQHDRNCDELNFDDTLTTNDTVIYDMDNLIKNNGNELPINLDTDSYGYVVINIIGPSPPDHQRLIGNFRIVDNSGYEYRTNMAGLFNLPLVVSNYLANFNTADGAIFSDVIGYAYQFAANLPEDTVANFDPGFDFDIFVFDLLEEPISCDTRNFACGKIMNYGVNEDYKASRENNLLCPGGGLSDPKGGYISFENTRPNPTPGSNPDNSIFVGLIGINNGNGTGSMDYWIEGEIFFTPG